MRAPRFRRAACGILFLMVASVARAQQPDPPPPGTTRATRPQRPTLQHAQHRRVPCSSCHSSARRHGELLIRTPNDCMRCHHAGTQGYDCSRCHDATAMRRLPARPRSFRLNASRSAVTIAMRFDHRPHAAVTCAHCHADATSRAPDQENCGSCHALHHGPASNCTDCHGGSETLAKHSRNDHTTCATAACHGPAAAALPTSREACLVCHTAQRAHVPGRTCTNCHPLRGPP